jgi:hypothetical protein
MYDFSLWAVLRDDLEEIVLRNLEGLDKRPLDALRYGLSILRRLVIWECDADQRHCHFPFREKLGSHVKSYAASRTTNDIVLLDR